MTTIIIENKTNKSVRLGSGTSVMLEPCDTIAAEFEPGGPWRPYLRLAGTIRVGLCDFPPEWVENPKLFIKIVEEGEDKPCHPNAVKCVLGEARYWGDVFRGYLSLKYVA